MEGGRSCRDGLLPCSFLPNPDSMRFQCQMRSVHGVLKPPKYRYIRAVAAEPGAPVAGLESQEEHPGPHCPST